MIRLIDMIFIHQSMNPLMRASRGEIPHRGKRKNKQFRRNANGMCAAAAPPRVGHRIRVDEVRPAQPHRPRTAEWAAALTPIVTVGPDRRNYRRVAKITNRPPDNWRQRKLRAEATSERKRHVAVNMIRSDHGIDASRNKCVTSGRSKRARTQSNLVNRRLRWATPERVHRPGTDLPTHRNARRPDAPAPVPGPDRGPARVPPSPSRPPP